MPSAACVDCGKHVDKPVKGMCGACYQRAAWKVAPPATCHPDRKRYAGGFCKPCYRAGNRALRAECHPERLRVARGLCNQCYRAEPDVKAAAVRARRLKKYSLSEVEYADMMTAQGFVCAICGSVPNAVDHCHDSGKVRGVLCRHCNTGLGHFKDNPEFLKAAIRYLEDRNDRR